MAAGLKIENGIIYLPRWQLLFFLRQIYLVKNEINKSTLLPQRTIQNGNT